MKKKLAIGLLFCTLTMGMAAADDTYNPGHKPIMHRQTWVQRALSFFHFYKGI